MAGNRKNQNGLEGEKEGLCQPVEHIIYAIKKVMSDDQSYHYDKGKSLWS